jgi:hypothetical protein
VRLLAVGDDEPLPVRVLEAVGELLYDPELEPELEAVLLAELLAVTDGDEDDEPLVVAEAVAEAEAVAREDAEAELEDVGLSTEADAEADALATEGVCELLAVGDDEPLPVRVLEAVGELLYDPELEPELEAVLLAVLLPVRDEDDDGEPLAVAEAVAEAEAVATEDVEAELENVGLSTEADAETDALVTDEGVCELLAVDDDEPLSVGAEDPVVELLKEAVLEGDPAAVPLAELLAVAEKDEVDEPLAVAELDSEAVPVASDVKEAELVGVVLATVWVGRDDAVAVKVGVGVLLAVAVVEPLPEGRAERVEVLDPVGAELEAVLVAVSRLVREPLAEVDGVELAVADELDVAEEEVVAVGDWQAEAVAEGVAVTVATRPRRSQTTRLMLWLWATTKTRTNRLLKHWRSWTARTTASWWAWAKP